MAPAWGLIDTSLCFSIGEIVPEIKVLSDC